MRVFPFIFICMITLAIVSSVYVVFKQRQIREVESQRWNLIIDQVNNMAVGVEAMGSKAKQYLDEINQLENVIDNIEKQDVEKSVSIVNSLCDDRVLNIDGKYNKNLILQAIDLWA